jgi:hypothetical protein
MDLFGSGPALILAGMAFLRSFDFALIFPTPAGTI